MGVTLALVRFLSALDVIIRRHDRLLGIGFASTILGIIWLAHMLSFPGVIPGRTPLVSSQTAPYLFQLGQIGTPLLLTWILLQRPAPLVDPRRSLARALGAAASLGALGVAIICGLALVLPPLIVAGRFTALNTLLATAPFVAVALAAAPSRHGRQPDGRIQSRL